MPSDFLDTTRLLSLNGYTRGINYVKYFDYKKNGDRSNVKANIILKISSHFLIVLDLYSICTLEEIHV